MIAKIYIMVFCVMAACSPAGAYQHFRAKYRLHLEANLQKGVVHSSKIFVPRIAVCGVITQKTTIKIV